MRRLAITFDVTAPAERVWQIMQDIPRWPEWTPGVSAVEWVRGDGVVPGAQVRIRQPGFPPALWTVTEVRPGRGFSWASTVPGLRVMGLHTIEPTDTGARVTLALEFHGPLGALWAWLTRAPTERNLAAEARGLRARSELAAAPLASAAA